MITRPSRDCSGNAFLCEDVLAEEGVTDFDRYAYLPGAEPQVNLYVGTTPDSVIEQAGKPGGQVVQEPRQAPGVSFALIADPQGHAAGLAQQG